MDNKENKKLISYSLSGIKSNRFNFSTPKGKFVVEEVKIDYTINPTIKYNIEEDLIFIIINVIAKINDTEEIILDSENTFIYHAKDLKTFMEPLEDTKSWKFKDQKDEGLIVTILGISISTLRGILYEKSRGTILELKLIPIVNPSVFIKTENK